MNIEQLNEDELKDLILKKQLEWIKLCQDNFLIFAETVWQDFIYRKETKEKGKGHHQIIAESFVTKINETRSQILFYFILSFNHYTIFWL